MRVGNVVSHVCLCVCVSVCLSVQVIAIEPLHIETSFLVCRYIFTLSIKVIASRSRSYENNADFTYCNMWLHVINKVKVT